MQKNKTAGQVFDEWASDRRARNMSDHHWPVVAQAFELIPPQRGNYLEIGVGNGYAIRQMATHQFADGACLGIDVSQGMVKLAKAELADLDNVKIEQADFLSTAFVPEKKYDVIFSMEVFYYFSDVQQGIEKAFSLLNAGGRLFVMVDYYRENTINHTWPQDLETPMTLWSRAGYEASMESAGFLSIMQRTFVDPHNPKRDPLDLGTLCTIGTRIS